MTTETTTKLKIDDTPAELMTIAECHAKAGKFPFSMMKMKLVSPTRRRLFEVVEVQTYGLNEFKNDGTYAYKTTSKTEIIFWNESQTWILLR